MVIVSYKSKLFVRSQEGVVIQMHVPYKQVGKFAIFVCNTRRPKLVINISILLTGILLYLEKPVLELTAHSNKHGTRDFFFATFFEFLGDFKKSKSMQI